MRWAAMLLVLLPLAAPDAGAAMKVFYLDHADATMLPQLIGRLARDGSLWVEKLQPHWAGLEGHLTVKADLNAIEAQGSAEALAALRSVIDALDVPRRTVALSYRQVHVADPALLVGKPVGPPTGDADLGDATDEPRQVRVAPGEWVERVRKLAEAGQATILHEGKVRVFDGSWGAVYIGDPEAEPELCFQARPLFTDRGELWLTVAFGRIERRGPEDAELPEVGQAAGAPVRCVACGPGGGDVKLVTELTVSSLLRDRQSLLVDGGAWSANGEDPPPGSGHDFLILTARLED